MKLAPFTPSSSGAIRRHKYHAVGNGSAFGSNCLNHIDNGAARAYANVSVRGEEVIVYGFECSSSLCSFDASEGHELFHSSDGRH
jgi:hypothetical protein